MKKYLHYLQAFCCLIIAVFALMSCLDTPSKPTHCSPFDPLNPDTHGDPYNIRAALADSAVQLDWDAVEWQPLIGYSIFRSYNLGVFSPLRQVGKQTLQYYDRNVQDGCYYRYHVVIESHTGTTLSFNYMGIHLQHKRKDTTSFKL